MLQIFDINAKENARYKRNEIRKQDHIYTTVSLLHLNCTNIC